MTHITLRTKAWMGDEARSFVFPDPWEVVVCPPTDGATMDDAAIQRALANPIGTERLSRLARGAKSATIMADDLARPTPAARIAPFVLDELRAAGVPEEGIRFVIGGGSHRPLTEREIAKKLGQGVVDRYQVLNHSAYSGKLIGLGNLKDGTPVYINPAVAEAEVKIALGGILPHPSAGMGGGAKMVVPGVSGIATIAYSHRLFPGRPRGTIEMQGQTEDVRSHAERVARFIGLDIIVNTVINSRREVAGLFVGDVLEAHRAGFRFAQEVYGTPIPEHLAEEADIVVINAYPLDYDPIQIGKSCWPIALFKNAYKVMISPATDGIFYHGLGHGMDYARHLMLRQKAPATEIPQQAAIRDTDQMIALSEHFDPADFYKSHKDGALFTSWEPLVAELQRVCPTAKVVVLPCAPMQIPQVV